MKLFTCVMLVTCGGLVLPSVCRMHLPVPVLWQWLAGVPTGEDLTSMGKKQNVDWPVCLECLS